MKVSEDFTMRSKLADIGRFYITEFVKSVAQSLPGRTSLLDAGAGECAYKRYFSHCNYMSVDMAIGEANWNYSNVDCIVSLNKLPMKDESFDVVLCTQVLEHLQKPVESVKEMYRVLKRGGNLFLTAPMSHSEHQIPYDFFRYTSYGLRYLCSEAGFQEIDVAPMGGMFVRWAYEVTRVISIFPEVSVRRGIRAKNGLLWAPVKLICFFLVRFLQIILLNLDRFDKKKNDPFGWRVIGKK
jgi:SAM-dependent methyltransferase